LIYYISLNLELDCRRDGGGQKGVYIGREKKEMLSVSLLSFFWNILTSLTMLRTNS
jgi:hypothetical protein